jgi:hypothetical protein
LLAFARKQELNVEPVEVIELIRGMADLLQSSVGASIRIETQFPLRLSPAHTDQLVPASVLALAISRAAARYGRWSGVLVHSQNQT